MSNALYTQGKKKLLDEGLDDLTFKMMLVDSSYTFDVDEDVMTNPLAAQISGTGYTAGGATVTITATADNTNNWVLVDCGDTSWAGYSAGEVKAAIIYIDDTTDVPFMYIDEDFPLNTTGGNLEVNTPNGLFSW